MRNPRKKFGKRARLNALLLPPSPDDARRLSQPVLARRVAGYLAKRQGEQFEDEIEATCRRYARSDIALFARSRPKTGGPPGRMFFVERGQVDFVGNWRGVPVAFDTKSVGADPASWRFHEKDLFQAEFLRDWQRIDGIAFVLLRVRLDNRQEIVYVLTDVEALARGEAITLRSRQSKCGAPVERTAPYLEYNLAYGWDFIRKVNELIEVQDHENVQGGADRQRLGGGSTGAVPAVQAVRQADDRGAVRPAGENRGEV